MESIDALITLGKSQLENGSFHEALESFEQAILLDQNNPDLWNFMGVTHFQNNIQSKLKLYSIHMNQE